MAFPKGERGPILIYKEQRTELGTQVNNNIQWLSEYQFSSVFRGLPLISDCSFVQIPGFFFLNGINDVDGLVFSEQSPLHAFFCSPLLVDRIRPLSFKDSSE